MLPSSHWHTFQQVGQRARRLRRLHVVGVLLLFSLIGTELLALNSPLVDAQVQSHTIASVDENCQHVAFSPDGNPFPLCPGPYPVGGNCVWWAWEQWHLLGYDLPLNWGNAADWVVDAERSGLPLGATPRVGAIAVFPRADGVWAYGEPGHVAFVTNVSDDGSAFDVTYQNFGSATPMYVGKGYNVSYINQSRFQNGELRFIYFPREIDPLRFAQLPGMNGATNFNALALNKANTDFTSNAAVTGDRVALGLPPVSSDQEFNADFTGEGYSDLLLYNREQGSLKVMKLRPTQPPKLPQGYVPNNLYRQKVIQQQESAPPMLVNLGDTITPANQWGSSLDVHIGDFAGTGGSDILLYNRDTGTMQILSLSPDLTIKKHVTLSGWGPDWELYVGRLDGQRSGLFMYKRFAEPDLTVTDTPTPADQGPTITDTPSDSPTATKTPKPDPTVPVHKKPDPTPTADPTVHPTATPTVHPSATADPTVHPTGTPTPTVKVDPTVTPTKTPQASPTVDPTVTRVPTPTPTARPGATPTPDPTAARPTVTPTVKPKVTPGPRASATHITKLTPTITVSVTLGDGTRSDIQMPLSTLDAPSGTHDLSGSALADWEEKGRTANILIIDFTKDFSIHTQQSYTLWHANWEVYVGHFASQNRDGIFLYDRTVGEGRIMDFDKTLAVANYQEMHNLDGNWIVYSGDFIGTGRAQLLLYDPGAGNGQLLTFAPDLSLQTQKLYNNWGTNKVLYVGHFGMKPLSIMLYDPQDQRSDFIALDKTLAVTQQYTVQSWGPRWQILVGAFLDRSRCLRAGNCSTGDDILALDRKTGQIQQFIFSFGRNFKVYDNRVQAFVRTGVASDLHLNSVNTTTFSLVDTLNTSIRNEEVY